jgi:SAM-dependent MidA family methyltransferase
MKPPATQARSPSLPARLRELAGTDGALSFRDFMAVALFAPELGYYSRKDLARVGRRTETDFYTSSSLSSGVFGRLVRTAAHHLIAPENPESYALCEIGAEPGAGVFGTDTAPFAKMETRSLGDSLKPPSHAIVFANEWLDAQPFNRLVFRRGVWRELGVLVREDVFTEVELAEISLPAKVLLPLLPEKAAEDYHLDISLDAENLLLALAATPWKGGLIIADYGHDWATLVNERPAGTARAYFKHQVISDLLARSGEQDLTCHVCWSRLENVLQENGFEDVRVERQEAFFVRHAASEIEKILMENPEGFSSARQTLLELLHPAHLGQKFQILSARRT